MADQQPFQFSYSASEVETLLTSIKNKMDKSIIDTVIDALKTGVPSTPAVHSVIESLKTATTGDGLKDAINAATDCNVFKDSHKTLLEQGGFQFVGSPATITERNDLTTTNYVGGETILLQSNEFGVATVQYWHQTSQKWVDVDQSKASSFEKTFNGTAKQELVSVAKTKFSIYTFKIMGKTSSNFHMRDVHVGLDLSGTTAYLTSTNDFYGTGKLFEVTVDYDGTNMVLSLTPTTNTTNVRMELIAAY